MSIARAIVDVPANQTDRPFDYLIPNELLSVIKPGMRVVVPFGVRTIQGFVIEIKNETNVKKIKPLIKVLDITPVLTEELLQLGFWLTKKTFCYAVTAFQVMLPAAMKVKYEKIICLIDKDESRMQLSGEVADLFQDRSTINWQEIEDNRRLLPIVQKHIQSGHLEVIYQVKDRAKVKKAKYVKSNYSNSKLTELMNELPQQAIKQKEVLEYLLTIDKELSKAELINTLHTTASPINSLIEKGILVEEEREIHRDPYRDRTFEKTSSLPLTTQQQKAISPILSSVEQQVHHVFLMYGVTGSGKTEIYLQSIAKVIEAGKEAIVLVPEIALTPMMVQRFKSRFGSKVAVMHSGLSQGEKYDEWRKVQSQKVKVVVGARSAIFAPFKNLGIIIIDEEHESSYKQEDNPRYHARDVAIWRGQYYRCPVILGSATPTLESYARAKKGVYRLLSLTERVNQRKLPAVDVIDMRDELRNGNRSMFSTVLYEKLVDRLKQKQQSVLFLNRRGFSTFVMCRDCGYVIECPHCDISLTYHKRQHVLKCHYCSYEMKMPSCCPECASEHIRFFGTGTQKVEEELSKVLPEARVIRMDVDTTRKKGMHEKLLAQFAEKKADILLGTQMIAKGLDFPDVTLVGVLAADSMLHLPDFRASEKTFQLLTQVSGRAGRHQLPGEVVVQTYTPEHYSIQLAKNHDYENFYFREMLLRKQLQYPPYFFIALITVSHPDLMKVVQITDKIALFLKRKVRANSIDLGPVACAVPKIKDRYRYQCMIKYKDEPDLTNMLREMTKLFQEDINKNQLQIQIDLKPHMMM